MKLKGKMLKAFCCLLIFSVPPVLVAEEWSTVVGGGSDSKMSAFGDDSVEKKQAKDDGGWETVVDTTWKAVDNYQVSIIRSLDDAGLPMEDRLVLLDNLIESRYAFEEKLSQDNVSAEDAHKIFKKSWEKSAVVLKKNAVKNGVENQRIMSVIKSAEGVTKNLSATSSNTVSFIEEAEGSLASVVGDIPQKKDGAKAGMKKSPQKKELRSFFGFDPVVSVGEETKSESDLPATPDLGKDKKKKKQPQVTGGIAPRKIDWHVTRDNFDSYLVQTKGILEETVEKIFAQGKVPEKYHQLYRDFVLSAAWQESCFRQFTKKDGELSYIRSYNGTSVGFMQINERVWKDIYDVERLRSDARYNIQAGSEIAYLYLHRYALRKMNKMKPRKELSETVLSRTLYAMYNGGPGEFHKFLKRLDNNNVYKSDDLYHQKYEWVTKDQWQKLTICLFGK